MSIPSRRTLRRAACHNCPASPNGEITRFDRIVLGRGWPGLTFRGAIDATFSIESAINAVGEITQQINAVGEITPQITATMTLEPISQ